LAKANAGGVEQGRVWGVDVGVYDMDNLEVIFTGASSDKPSQIDGNTPTSSEKPS